VTAPIRPTSRRRSPPFVPQDGGREFEVVLRAVADRGWVVRDPHRVVLTPVGRAARARIGEAVIRSRARITEGIDAEQYQQVMRTLARMAENLAWRPDEEEACPA
jgi:hypothetical protein